LGFTYPELVPDLVLEAHLRLFGFLSCFRLELVPDLEPDLELEAAGRRCFLQKPFW
jgi:hypothetical protein